MENVLAIILAGGEGKRLFPLTTEHPKPAVPFGGKWKIFDFVMNNILNSEIGQTLVLTQFYAQPLIDHADRFGYSSPLYGKSVRVVPAQQRSGRNWYQGTADAVFQNLRLIHENEDADTVAILAGDHIYKIDLRQVYEFHRMKGAAFTVCAFAVPVDEASEQFGVIQVDEQNHVIGFEEKPKTPKEIPGRPGYCFASMGNYIADIEFLAGALGKDAANVHSQHDFGKDIIPSIISARMPIFAYDFAENKIAGERGPYWRDVGTIAAFHAANMDLVQPEPELNLYNRHWPLRTLPDNLPPAKNVHRVLAQRIIASGGCVFDGSEDMATIISMAQKGETHLESSVFGRNVRIGKDIRIAESIVFEGARIGNGVILKGAIVEQGVRIPDGVCVGCDHVADERQGLTVVDDITIVPRGFKFP